MSPAEPPNGRLAIFPGSFDPLTNGHVDIILRSAHLFERIVGGGAGQRRRSSRSSRPTSASAIIREVFREYPNIEVESFDGLLVRVRAPAAGQRDRPRHPRRVRLRV